MRIVVLKRVIGLVAAVASVAVLSACALSALGQQPATTVYVLSTAEDRGMPAAAGNPAVGNQPTIGVSTVGFPPYLERKEIVTRATDSQLVVHQFDKWGSAPDEDFTRTVAANLRAMIPTPRAVTPPFRSELPLDYEVRISVERFERLADGTVVLDARWNILSQPDGRTLTSTSAQIRIANVSQSIPDVVAAMSVAVGQLSEQIAAELMPFTRLQQKVS